MPTKPKKIIRPWSPPKSNKRSEYDKRYHSKQWRDLRLIVLKNNPLCVECKKQGKTVLAQEADHIQPVRLEGDFWNIDNLQGLCKSHHGSKSSKERRK